MAGQTINLYKPRGYASPFCLRFDLFPLAPSKIRNTLRSQIDSRGGSFNNAVRNLRKYLALKAWESVGLR